jgi:hypothetical protein
MTQWLTSEIAKIQTLVLGGAVLVAIIFIVGVFWRTKALVPVLVAMVTSGIVLWGLHNTSWFQTKVGNETAAQVMAPSPAIAHEPRGAATGHVPLMVTAARPGGGSLVVWL